MSEEHDIITVQSGRGMQMLNVWLESPIAQHVFTEKKYIYIYSDKLQYNCTVTRLYYITIQLYSDKAIEKTT